MNIRFLESALCLADCKNFRVAAERLHLTPAAISSRIAVLEEEFGQRLFDRSSKHVTLTPVGEKFVTAATEVLASYVALQKAMKRQHGKLEGIIRIGAVSSMADFLLPQLITRIRRLHPTVTLEVATDDTGRSFQDQLKQGAIDFCLTALPDHVAAGINVEELCIVSMAWVGSSKLLAMPGRPLSKDELAAYPIISYAPGSVNGERIRHYLHDTGVDHRSFLTSGSLSAMIRMATEGLGLAVIPEFMAAREIREGALHKLELVTPYPSTRYCAMHSKLSEKGDISSLSALSLEISSELCRQTRSIQPVPLIAD